MKSSGSNLKETFLHRLRNQLGNILTSFTMLALVSSGVILGAVGGLFLGRVLETSVGSGSGWIVILTTSLGFTLGMIASSALSPRMIRLSFRATPVKDPATLSMVRELQEKMGHRFSFTLYSVDEGIVTGFGHNVVVTGLPQGRGSFRPAVFASKSVLKRCSEDELYAILSHELAHLREAHLVKRITGGIVNALGGSLAVSLMLVGLQMMGLKSIAMVFATFAPLVPVTLIWMNLQRLMNTQEKEADWLAIRHFHARPLDLLNALKKLTLWNASGVHPLVKERMLILQGLWLAETAPVRVRDAA